MATLVLEQDESVRQIETTAVQANTDVESGCVTLSCSAASGPSLTFPVCSKQSQANPNSRQVSARRPQKALVLLRCYRRHHHRCRRRCRRRGSSFRRRFSSSSLTSLASRSTGPQEPEQGLDTPPVPLQHTLPNYLSLAVSRTHTHFYPSLLGHCPSPPPNPLSSAQVRWF